MLLKEGNKNIDEISMREEWYGGQFMCGLTIGGFGELLQGVVRMGNEDFNGTGRPIPYRGTLCIVVVRVGLYHREPLCVLWW